LAEGQSSPLFWFLSSTDYLWIYIGIVGWVFVLTFLRIMGLVTSFIRSSTELHRNLFAAVIRAPMRFFEENSFGKSGPGLGLVQYV
jgi:ABC-type multidrug transport system fused ATPase/permease subunit